MLEVVKVVEGAMRVGRLVDAPSGKDGVEGVVYVFGERNAPNEPV